MHVDTTVPHAVPRDDTRTAREHSHVKQAAGFAQGRWVWRSNTILAQNQALPRYCWEERSAFRYLQLPWFHELAAFAMHKHEGLPVAHSSSGAVLLVMLPAGTLDTLIGGGVLNRISSV